MTKSAPKQKESFWGGEQPEVNFPAVPKEEYEKLKFNKKWLPIIPAIMVAIVAAVLINQNLGHESTLKVSERIDIDNGDQNTNWSKYATNEITLSEPYTIYKSGIYKFTGTLNGGGITVNATDGEVKIILENAIITNPNGPAIACIEGRELVIESLGVNYLEDGKTYSQELDEDISGAIYSKADLSFWGDGTLKLIANYQDGVVSKDDLSIRSGTYIIDAADDAIRGKDSVYITGGNLVLTATADGIKSTNNVDEGKGFVYIENGEITMNVGDDGVHAENYLIIDDGKIAIEKSYEGLEGVQIEINGGEISIKASDDGINAGSGTSESNTPRPGGMMDADENCIISINGGNIYVNANGDGLDSNGYIYINGGRVLVDGPTNNGNGALDAGIQIVANGGTAIAVGSSGMAESFSSDSKINSVSIYLSAAYAPGSVVTIVDKETSGVIFEHAPAKRYAHIAAASTDFTIGKTYILYIDDTKIAEFTPENVVTVVGQNGNQINGRNQIRR